MVTTKQAQQRAQLWAYAPTAPAVLGMYMRQTGLSFIVRFYKPFDFIIRRPMPTRRRALRFQYKTPRKRLTFFFKPNLHLLQVTPISLPVLFTTQYSHIATFKQPQQAKFARLLHRNSGLALCKSY